MTRGEAIARFREECPEITSRTITDAVLQGWCEVGEKEVAAKTRIIKGDTTFSSVIGVDSYDLTDKITNFFDIDELPGGGVIYDNDPLEKTSIAELDQENETWRSNANGTPYKYFRRGNFLKFEKPASAVKDIQVYTILISDAWDDDNKEPFNELSYLDPYHYIMVLYLIKRGKKKIGKPEDIAAANSEYYEFLNWMKSEENQGTHCAIQLKPKRYYS